MATVTQQQAPSTLPHLPKGMAMQHTAKNDNPLPMPGKHLQDEEARWKSDHEPNAVEAPSAEGQRASRRDTSSPASWPSPSEYSELEIEEPRQQQPQQQQQQLLQQPQGAVQQRESKALVEPEPAPLFLAHPSRNFSLSRRESKIQRQVYRMDTGINPVDILTDRLEAWRMSIKNLVALFKYIRGIELRSATGYCKSTKVLANPFHESSGQFMASGGIREVWNAFRNYSMEQSVMHQDYVNYLDRAVLPSLRNIKQDIKNLLKAITRDKGLRSSVLYEGRRRVDNLMSELDKTIQLDLQMPETAYKRHDPLLLNCAVFKACRDLHNSENNLHSNVLNLQREVGMFERNLIENCRVVCHKFQDFRLSSKMESHSALGHITGSFKDIKPDSEWNEFVRRNQGNLISENAAYKTDQDIHYPNQQHDLVQPIKVGLLERKAGVMRNWTEGLYVLTPAGFLHGYKSAAHFDADPLGPDVSIFVPHTNINHARNSDSSYQGSTFEIRGRNTQSSIGREKDFCFRARDPADLQDWFSKLVQMSDRFQPVPLLKDFDQDRALPAPPSDDEQDGNFQQQTAAQQQEQPQILQQQQQQEPEQHVTGDQQPQTLQQAEKEQQEPATPEPTALQQQHQTL